jgi:hypothetical protein
MLRLVCSLRVTFTAKRVVVKTEETEEREREREHKERVVSRTTKVVGRNRPNQPNQQRRVSRTQTELTAPSKHKMPVKKSTRRRATEQEEGEQHAKHGDWSSELVDGC